MNSGRFVLVCSLCGGVVGWIWWDNFMYGVVGGMIAFLIINALGGE